MYKIYINETPLILIETAKFSPILGNGENLTVRYAGKTKQLLQVADMLEKTKRFNSVTIHGPDLKKLWKDFKSLYKVIKAAGGVVSNEKGEILVMYRRGTWDLPKGKIDPGETKKQAAVREVEEETGISNIELGKKICRTLHTYTIKGKRVLKYSYWYKMTAPKTKLIPQTEEDIEECRWMKKKAFLEECSPIYGNIQEVLSQ